MALPTQGMMLSERPSSNVGDDGGGGGGGGSGTAPLAGAGSIGNYKGVMLCNRPFAGTAAAARGSVGRTSSAVGKSVFVTGKVKSEVGFAGKGLQTEKLLRKRVKKETALTRHRRWLADLQLTKQALEEQYMEDLQRKEESKRRFAEREALMRQTTRELMQREKTEVGGAPPGNEVQGSQAWSIGLDDNDDVDPETSTASPTNDVCPTKQDEQIQRSVGAEKEMEGKNSPHRRHVENAELRAVEKRRKRNGKPCLPKWAMTKARAEKEDELMHEEELEELLEFTQGLDFGKYIRDAEVKTMIDQVKKRISEIEGQPEVDDERCSDDGEEGDNGRGGEPLDEAEARLEAKILKLTNKNLCDMETFHGSDGLPTDNHEEDDNVSVARTALSEGGRSVRSIHSTRSLAAIAEKARVGIVTSRASENGVGTAPARIGDRRASTREGVGWTDEAVNDIVVVTHQDDGGLRLGGKNTVSTLPYIRRNPAV